MKLEKREVTLDEKDTLKDLLAFERMLLQEYAILSPVVEGKERRSYFSDCLVGVLENVFLLADLLQEGSKEIK